MHEIGVGILIWLSNFRVTACDTGGHSVSCSAGAEHFSTSRLTEDLSLNNELSVVSDNIVFY